VEIWQFVKMIFLQFRGSFGIFCVVNAGGAWYSAFTLAEMYAPKHFSRWGNPPRRPME